MSQASRAFQLVEDPAETPQAAAPAPQPRQPFINGVSVQMLSMALSALSQRAITALAACFALLTVGSAFFLWWQTPAPTDRQIVSLTIYAAFVLAINVIVRGK
jgi:hypothetical protein